MKTRSPVLTVAAFSLAAVGAAHTVLAARRHRDLCAVATVEMHHRLLAEQHGQNGLSAMWPSLAELSDEERTRTVHCNRWLVFWALQFRLRIVPAGSMREIADVFMELPENRNIWRQSRSTRLAEIRDSSDRKFFEIFDDAYFRESQDEDHPVGTSSVRSD
jgi:hypothetical protein